MLVNKTFSKRFGDPVEITVLFAKIMNQRLGYLTETDIIMDGDCIDNLGVYQEKNVKTSQCNYKNPILMVGFYLMQKYIHICRFTK